MRQASHRTLGWTRRADRTENAAISGPQPDNGTARTPPGDARAAIDEIKAMVHRLSEPAPGTPAASELVAAIAAALEGLADRLR